MYEDEKFKNAIAKRKISEKQQLLAEVRDLQSRFNAFLQENNMESKVSNNFKYRYKPNTA